MKTTWLIGQRWKCGNICSLLILIGRGLDQNENIWIFISPTKSKISVAKDSYILNVSSFESIKKLFKDMLTKHNKNVIIILV